MALTFDVQQDGAITNLAITHSSGIDTFDKAAYDAIAASNPTQRLPTKYPGTQIHFTLTFFYNASPPQQ